MSRSGRGSGMASRGAAIAHDAGRTLGMWPKPPAANAHDAGGELGMRPKPGATDAHDAGHGCLLPLLSPKPLLPFIGYWCRQQALRYAPLGYLQCSGGYTS